jgi:hypothetical protein
MSSDQRKQLMTKGFLYSTVVLVLATCGIVPAIEDRASQTPSRHERQTSRTLLTQANLLTDC